MDQGTMVFRESAKRKKENSYFHRLDRTFKRKILAHRQYHWPNYLRLLLQVCSTDIIVSTVSRSSFPSRYIYIRKRATISKWKLRSPSFLEIDFSESLSLESIARFSRKEENFRRNVIYFQGEQGEKKEKKKRRRKWIRYTTCNYSLV